MIEARIKESLFKGYTLLDDLKYVRFVGKGWQRIEFTPRTAIFINSKNPKQYLVMGLDDFFEMLEQKLERESFNPPI